MVKTNHREIQFYGPTNIFRHFWNNKKGKEAISKGHNWEFPTNQ